MMAMRAQDNLNGTRATILRAAVACFEREGFDKLGIRAIAIEAGVSPALVIRYFGTKAELFRCVVEEAFRGFDTTVPLTAALAPALIRYLLTDPEAVRAAHIVVRSAGSDDAATILRDFVQKRFIAPAVEADSHPGADLRLGMLVALLTGWGMVRDVLQLNAFKEAGPDEKQRLLERLVFVCLTPG